MLKNNNKIVSKVNIFDIETTGFSASDEIVCFSYGGFQRIQTKKVSEKDLLLELSEIVRTLFDDPIVTFFGEPKYGTTQGFDIPVVRTRYLLNNIPEEYPFRGKQHIDLTEVTRKYFNKRVLQEPSVSLLSAAQVTELVQLCGLFPLKTKDANVQQLEKAAQGSTIQETINEFIKDHVELKSVDHNSLDKTFKLFCPSADPSLLNEEFDGKDMPMLFKRFKEDGNEKCLEEILLHNQNCIKKTTFLYNAFIGNGLLSPLSIPTSKL